MTLATRIGEPSAADRTRRGASPVLVLVASRWRRVYTGAGTGAWRGLIPFVLIGGARRTLGWDVVMVPIAAAPRWVTL